MPLIIMPNKRLIGILLAATLILLVPLVAMQFTAEVNWDLTDFVVAGVLLFGTGLLYELAARQTGNRAYRAAVGVAAGTALILVWMNLAVGLIGSEDNPANLMYGGVLGIGFIGALLARFRPRGMARALWATALAQALVPVIALIIFRPSLENPADIVGVFFLNVIFVMLFAGSAMLFRRVGAAGSEVKPTV